VPLVLAGRGIAAGESERVVQLVDVVPTIRELLGLPALAAVDGASLVPLLDGKPRPPRPAFSEAIGAPGDCLRHGEQDSCKVDRRAVQDDRWKLVTSRLPPQARLFDLASDPEESRDVSADFPAERLRLEEHLAAYEALQPGAPAAAATPRLDADTIERLRLLGYTD
jgi:arylsulfatase A-like enzyme